MANREISTMWDMAPLCSTAHPSIPDTIPHVTCTIVLTSLFAVLSSSVSVVTLPSPLLPSLSFPSFPSVNIHPTHLRTNTLTPSLSLSHFCTLTPSLIPLSLLPHHHPPLSLHFNTTPHPLLKHFPLTINDSPLPFAGPPPDVSLFSLFTLIHVQPSHWPHKQPTSLNTHPSAFLTTHSPP